LKDLLYTASINSGDDRIVSNTNSDWSKILEGSLIRFQDDPLFYNVLRVNKVFIFEKFEVLDLRRIKVNSNTKFSIAKNDELNLTWDEYELSTVAGINQSGKGYKANDIIYCQDGVAAENTSDLSHYRASFRISEVSEDGTIKQISLESRGRYFVKPEKSSCQMTGGNGNGAIFDLVFFNTEDRFAETRTVQVINPFEKETIILLDSSLPRGLKCGNITLTKWEVLLSSKYGGETKINSPYELYHDFTPHCKMPMPVRNSIGLDILIKNTQLILDAKIAKLEQDVDSLKKALASQQPTGS
jgi:hypothetical protein